MRQSGRAEGSWTKVFKYSQWDHTENKGQLRAVSKENRTIGTKLQAKKPKATPLGSQPHCGSPPNLLATKLSVYSVSGIEKQ